MSRRSTIANAEVIPYALYLLGGAGRYVDVEDVFFRCYEIAPQRLSWRPSPAELQDGRQGAAGFRRRFPPRDLKTQDGLGRQPSAEGLVWVRARIEAVQETFGQPSGGMARRPSQRLLDEFASNPLVEKYLHGERVAVSRYHAAEFVWCAPDSPPDVWKERLETYRSAAERVGRSDLTGFLKTLEEDHPDWFGGSGVMKIVYVGMSGVVRYTGRAVRQEDQDAMGGDIVRGLIELVDELR